MQEMWTILVSQLGIEAVDDIIGPLSQSRLVSDLSSLAETLLHCLAPQETLLVTI